MNATTETIVLISENPATTRNDRYVPTSRTFQVIRACGCPTTMTVMYEPDAEQRLRELSYQTCMGCRGWRR